MRYFCVLMFAVGCFAADPGYWPEWRGPAHNGMAPTAVPTEWSATKNLAWKRDLAGRGHSSPVIWGDRLFITNAIPIESAASETRTAEAPPRGGRGGPGGGTGVGIEHRF